MQITGTNNEPAKYGPLWCGTANDGGNKIEWFYQPGIYLHTRREERPGMWINFDPPACVRRLVLKPVRTC
jgi:hypothetical protein